jgi:two-component system response regulator PrrA
MTASDHSILIVDDDPDIRTSLTMGLQMSGFVVSAVADGPAALATAGRAHGRPDAMVLDMNLPGLDGVAVVTALRAMGVDIPICVLSARSSVSERIIGLEAGADDYLVKPFDLGELVARLRALLRRPVAREEPAAADPRMVTVGAVRIDLGGRAVSVDGQTVALTKREFDLLGVLAENVGIALSRNRLLELVWGYDFPVETKVVDVFVGYLRRKLEADGASRVVHTVRGYGFVLRDHP